MSDRQVAGFVTGVVVLLALVAACGGAPKETGAAAPAAAPAPEEPARAANDPAEPVAPAGTPESAPTSYDPATAAGAVKGVPAATNTGSIEAVANFFTELPGFDLTPLTKSQRDHLLHRVNSELCTCGCKHETLAFCLVNDPKCPDVKGLVQNVYDEIKSGR